MLDLKKLNNVSFKNYLKKVFKNSAGARGPPVVPSVAPGFSFLCPAFRLSFSGREAETGVWCVVGELGVGVVR